MECPHCGYAATPGDAFCGACGFDLRRVPATDQGVDLEKPSAPEPAVHDEPRRRVWTVAFVAALAAAALMIAFVVLRNGDGEEPATSAASSPLQATSPQPDESAPQPAPSVSSGPGETPGEIFLEPAGSHGPDPYTGELFADPVVPTPAPLAPPTPAVANTASPGQVVVAGHSGSEPGLYGGTRDDARCDAFGMLAFMQANPERAAAWAAAQDADPDLIWGDGETALDTATLPDFFAELTPVTLLQDTRVTNHGFRDGRATPRQSVLQAGTAVLVDRLGVPRARCACGNPLTPAQPARTTPDYVGEGWADFRIDDLAVVEPSSEPIDEFILADLRTGDRFARPAGGDGRSDAAPGIAVHELVAEEYPVTQDIGIGATYDSASFSVELDPSSLDWIAFSGAESLEDVGTGDVERVPDGVPDLVFPNVDDYMVIVVTKSGVSSEPIIIHDRDAYGTPIGNQAVIYGTHSSVWLVSRIDWSTDPVTSYTATVAETGVLTSFFDTNGPGDYTFEVEFVNKWTGAVAHGPVYLLAG